ncbi:fungal-specific transcription factor domain-containing protein [Calycina marina]|uniref:Fungal-specific transcription factor domain-containing protein n=1 Tax=Calycina marina TaxID=1763456 RepID=A0A9P7YZX9_9HELO|nr:fungal-specific transcription factor domain-containing protein [Calycina marina]
MDGQTMRRVSNGLNTSIEAHNARRAPKSRNGCLRCKAKRLKCDEMKPECLQCTRKKVVCPGFQTKPLIWSTKHEKHMGTGASKLASHPVSPSATLVVSPFPSAAPNMPEEEEDTERHTSISLESHGTRQVDEPASPVAVSPVISMASTNSRGEQSTFTDSLSAIRQQLHRSTVPEFLLYLPTMLVEYYFSYVCQIFSSFDGSLNPFRSTVGKLWDGSAPIYYAIQSMAAAYLANHFPRMLPVGVQMQRETYKFLYQAQRDGLPNSENLDKTLLTVLLVGQTTAWHNPSDLGLVHLKTAKRLHRKRLEQQALKTATESDIRVHRQNKFFEQCIMYWDMLAGCVEDDVDELGFETEDYLGPRVEEVTDAMTEESRVFPHPWMGVAPKAQILFANVGRLIRKYRKLVAQDAASANFLSLDLGFDIAYPEDSLAMAGILARSQSLEEELLAFEPPSLTNLVDAGDENTPVQQYITLAECYRCAGLLQLYRIFPALLHKRIPVFGSNFEHSEPSDFSSQPTFDFLPIPAPQTADEFLVSLAIHVVSLLEKLAPTSGTRCLQPIVVITAAVELRFSSSASVDPASAFIPANPIFSSLTNREIDIATARRFVVTRLQEFQLSLPAKPIIKALELITETWERSDLGQDAYWMDVMADMGCASIFG